MDKVTGLANHAKGRASGGQVLVVPVATLLLIDQVCGLRIGKQLASRKASVNYCLRANAVL